MLLWRRAIWDLHHKQIFCLLFGENLSYKVCDESLAELEKLSQGRNGMCNIALCIIPLYCVIAAKVIL